MDVDFRLAALVLAYLLIRAFLRWIESRRVIGEATSIARNGARNGNA
jgi:hypothetical protein